MSKYVHWSFLPALFDPQKHGFLSSVGSVVVDPSLKLTKEGQTHTDEGPNPLRWDYAELQLCGTAGLVRPYMISSPSIDETRPWSFFLAEVA